jgi:hypothetical protein
MKGMRSYQETIGRAGIVVGLMIAAIFAAAVAQERNHSFRAVDQAVVIDSVAAATGE